MSSPPPLAPRSGMPSWLKWLLGITVGCFILIIACCAGGCIFGKSIGGDVIGKFQRAEQESAMSRASAERVAALDIDFPPRTPLDVAQAELTDEEVARYARVRRALEPQGAAYQAIVDRGFPVQGGAIGITRGVFGMLGASLDAAAARRALLEAAEPALRAESMGPAELARLAEIIEWRFLQREEARFLGLPESERREYLQLQVELKMLEAWTKGGVPAGFRVNNRTSADAAADLERERARMAALSAMASANTALTGGTQLVLQVRRSELEALSAAGLQAMAPLTTEPPFVSFVNSGDGVNIEHRSGSGEPAEPEPPPMLEFPATPEPATAP